MKIDKGLSRKEFKEKYPDNSSCLQYLAELKWADGYECKGCKSTTYSRGKQPYSRRCTKCQYDESATSGTLFHKIKFSISLAFEMLYEIVTCKIVFGWRKDFNCSKKQHGCSGKKYRKL